MTTEYSVEDLISMGTGLMTQKKEASTSIERFDGYGDELFAAVTRSEETLKFLDTFDMLQSKVSSEKLRMLKKINANYNGKTIGNANAANSIESYVNGQIYSLEDEAVTETNTEAKTGETDTKKDEKKKNFLKTMWEAIKKFMKSVKDLIRRIIAKIKTFFMKLKTKGDVELVKENPFGKDEEAYDLSTINFAGIKSYVAMLERFDAKADAAAKNADKKSNIGSRAADVVNQTSKLPTEEKEILDKLFGIKMLPGEAAWKKANAKVIKIVSENVPAILEKLDKVMGKLENISKVIEDAINNEKTVWVVKGAEGKKENLSAEAAAKEIRSITTSVNKVTHVATKLVSTAKTLITPKASKRRRKKG